MWVSDPPSQEGTCNQDLCFVRRCPQASGTECVVGAQLIFQGQNESKPSLCDKHCVLNAFLVNP